MDDTPELAACAARHGVGAAPVLTVADDEAADAIAGHLAPRVRGCAVVEIGGGLGLLALDLGLRAKRVFRIEANPIRASSFAVTLLARKKTDVSYLFGAAEQFGGRIRGDLSLFLTHSGVASMRREAARFAPEVIDVWDVLIAARPERFDPAARRLREIS